jgi:4-hydroxy-tetrahydrodipicolinate synthase
VPVIVTTTHFSTRICAERSRRRGRGRRDGHGHAALPWRDDPVPESGHPRVLRHAVGRVAIPIMIQDAPVSGVALSADLLARLAREVANVAYFKIEVPGAAAKLRELIRLGGDAVEGPWDGEEAITLMADLDAGATGTMPGGGYPDLLRPIVEAHAAGRREEAAEA